MDIVESIWRKILKFIKCKINFREKYLGLYCIKTCVKICSAFGPVYKSYLGVSQCDHVIKLVSFEQVINVSDSCMQAFPCGIVIYRRITDIDQMRARIFCVKHKIRFQIMD